MRPFRDRTGRKVVLRTWAEEEPGVFAAQHWRAARFHSAPRSKDQKSRRRRRGKQVRRPDLSRSFGRVPLYDQCHDAHLPQQLVLWFTHTANMIEPEDASKYNTYASEN